MLDAARRGFAAEKAVVVQAEGQPVGGPGCPVEAGRKFEALSGSVGLDAKGLARGLAETSLDGAIFTRDDLSPVQGESRSPDAVEIFEQVRPILILVENRREFETGAQGDDLIDFVIDGELRR